MTNANDVLNFLDARPDSEAEREALKTLLPTASEVVDELLAVQADIEGWASGGDYPPLDLEGVRQQDIEREILGRILKLQKLMLALPLIPASR
jgi:hypothetical protein